MLFETLKSKIKHPNVANLEEHNIKSGENTKILYLHFKNFIALNGDKLNHKYILLHALAENDDLAASMPQLIKNAVAIDIDCDSLVQAALRGNNICIRYNSKQFLQYNIHDLQAKLGFQHPFQLLFLHVLTGNDYIKSTASCCFWYNYNETRS